MALKEPTLAGTSDVDRYVFTENGPWEIDPDAIEWSCALNVLRSATRREVPRLTTPGRVPPLGRCVIVAIHVGWALGGWVLLDRWRGRDRSIAGLSRRLRMAAERLGPTYIKLGQILSSGEGLFPDPLVEEFKKCRDQVPAQPFDVVERIVESDLGKPMSAIFRQFDRNPLAAASIAQVHRATLITGERVVVKVQRLGIGERVRADLRVMAWIAPKLIGRIPVAALANPPALVELFAETILEELDFRLEAENMLDVAHAFAQLAQRGFVVARPHPRLVTRRVLVMEELSGHSWDDIEAMAADGISGAAVIRTGMQGFTEGSMVHGIFHGDLHGGNLFVMDDGRIALLDFGITARMTDLERSAFLRMMITAATGDIRGQLTAFRDLGALPVDVDLDWVMTELGLDQAPVDPTMLSQQELVDEIGRITKALLGMGARLPKVLMLYVKNLVFLDGSIARLAPDLDMVGEVMHLWATMSDRHGESLAATAGLAPGTVVADETALRAAFGVVDDTTAVTHDELRRRRELIRSRMSSNRRR